MGVESCDFSQAEKIRSACKAEQIHKITTILTQNNNLGPSQLYKQFFLSQHEKNQKTQLPKPKTRGHVEHLTCRALPDITSGPEVRQIFKIWTVWKPDIFLPGCRTFRNRKNPIFFKSFSYYYFVFIWQNVYKHKS